MKDNRTLYPYGAFLPFRDSLEDKWRPLLEEYSELGLDPIFVAEQIGIDFELLPQVCYHHGLLDPYRPHYDPMDDDLYMIRVFESIEKDATLRGFGIRVKTKAEQKRWASERKPSEIDPKPSEIDPKPSQKETTKHQTSTKPEQTKTEPGVNGSERKPSEIERKPSEIERKPIPRVKESTKQSIERRTGRPIREFLELGVSQGLSIRTLAKTARTSADTMRRLLMEMDIS